MTTFYKFALKIETSWAKKVIKSILELEMSMMLLCMFISGCLFPDKANKNMQCKKE